MERATYRECTPETNFRISRRCQDGTTSRDSRCRTRGRLPDGNSSGGTSPACPEWLRGKPPVGFGDGRCGSNRGMRNGSGIWVCLETGAVPDRPEFDTAATNKRIVRRADREIVVHDGGMCWGQGNRWYRTVGLAIGAGPIVAVAPFEGVSGDESRDLHLGVDGPVCRPD